MRYDVLIVGAGMTGATAARCLAEAGAKVLVVDARTHVGGNCYDEPDEHGVCIHRYGPHIFHTSRQKVVDFLSRFTTWRSYEHRVVGMICNRLVPLPVNLTSLSMLMGAAAGQELATRLTEAFGYGTQVPILELRKYPMFMEVADLVYAMVFEGYTRKQWGISPEGIDPAITARVPVRISHDDRYFTDSFQYMPAEGFTPLFTAMLKHENITLHTSTAFADVENSVQWKHCVYTGPVDEFFAACHGNLPYRSLDFVFEHYAQERHQPVAVVNYPDATVPFTRISEYRQLTGQSAATAQSSDSAQSAGVGFRLGTTVSLEYARPHVAGQTIPYYPVLTPASAAQLASYQATAHKECPHIHFAGRLGAFKYLNMDEAVLAGFAAAQHVLAAPLR